MEQLAERRREPRLAIVEEVFDHQSGSSLGHTADINATGMMLVGKQQFEPGEQVKVSVDVPTGKNKKIRTTLNAQCRWCETHLDTPFYNTGFKFIYATEFDVEYIQTLFFGFNN